MFCLIPAVLALIELQKNESKRPKRIKKLLALLISGPVVLELTACLAGKELMLLVVATFLTLEKFPALVLKHLLAAVKLIADTGKFVQMIATPN